MSADILNFKSRLSKGVQVTGPDMILIFWIARLALEDRDAYEYVKKELNLKGDEAAKIYDAICNFLETTNERREG